MWFDHKKISYKKDALCHMKRGGEFNRRDSRH